jgi:hypothetical protein
MCQLYFLAPLTRLREGKICRLEELQYLTLSLLHPFHHFTQERKGFALRDAENSFAARHAP